MTQQIACESCHNEFPETELRSFKRFDFLCQECYAKEVGYVSPKVEPAKVENGDTQIFLKKREEFFNAEKTAISEITGTPFERANKIKERITRWKAIIWEAQSSEYQAFYELQKLSQQLTQEERTKLQLTEPSYHPTEIKVKPAGIKKPRLSKEDKSLLVMAQAVFGAKLKLLDVVNAQCYKEHPDWWHNGAPKDVNKKEYNEYVVKNGAMTEELAIEKVKETVRASRALQFQQLASGERALSDPTVADSDYKQEK